MPVQQEQLQHTGGYGLDRHADGGMSMEACRIRRPTGMPTKGAYRIPSVVGYAYVCGKLSLSSLRCWPVQFKGVCGRGDAPVYVSSVT